MSGEKQSKTKERIFTVFFMFIVTVVFIAVLSLVYLTTQDTIKLNETLVLKRSILFAANIEVPKNKNAVSQLYDSKVRVLKEGRVYEIIDDGKLSSYVFLRNGAGLWGTITAVVGLKKDLKTTTGIEFTKQNETPGLGARISEAWFKEQFRAKRCPIVRLVAEKYPAGDGEFNAITGATISSTAVKNIINDLIEEAPKLVKSGY